MVRLHHNSYEVFNTENQMFTVRYLLSKYTTIRKKYTSYMYTYTYNVYMQAVNYF